MSRKNATMERPSIMIEQDSLAYTVPMFCKLHGISVRFYYELKKRGQGPAEMNLGGRVLVSRESAQRWREEQSAQPPALPARRRGRPRKVAEVP